MLSRISIGAARRLGTLGMALVVGGMACPGVAQCERWLPGGELDGAPSPYDRNVYASAAWDPDGEGPAPEVLVVGGYFAFAGGMPARNIAVWDGKGWSSLGAGLDGAVRSLVVFEGDLIAGGWFTVSGDQAIAGVARWDGKVWRAMGDGLDSSAEALHVYNGELIAGGWFQNSGDVPANYVARWSGTAWQQLGEGVERPVGTMTEFGGELVVGTYSLADVGAIRAWNGATWRTFPTTPSWHSVESLVVHGGALIAGGTHTTRRGSVQRWTGTAWEVLQSASSEMTGQVTNLCSYGSELIVAGNLRFQTRQHFVLRWTVSEWRPLGLGTELFTNSLSVFGGEVIAGGSFSVVGGGLAANAVAAWNGASWRRLGDGVVSGAVSALASHEGQLVLGGTYEREGDRCPVITWDGASLQSLGETNATGIRALTSYGGDLIAGGDFGVIDGVMATYVARHDGTAWHPMGPGITFGAGPRPAGVKAFATYDGALVAGGSFVGGGVVQWDGSEWQALGGGVANGVSVGDVAALVEYQGQLIAGGLFTTAGTIPAVNIAMWNGTSWSALGEGLGTPSGLRVHALAVFNGELIAAGGFQNSGATPITHIARWSAPNWLPLGEGVNSGVLALTVYNGELIAGGSFTRAGGVETNGLARWNGDSWTPVDLGLGGGSIPRVDSLLVHNGELVVGGDFTTVDGVESRLWARWTDTGVAWIAHQPGSQTVRAGQSVAISVTVASGYDEVAYEWRRDGGVVVDGPAGASPGGGTVSGASTATLRIDDVERSDAGEFVCTISNTCGEATSAPALLTVVCAADFDGDGVVNSQDFLDFLDAFFAGQPEADFNGDAVVNSQDFFDFLLAFFGVCK